MNLFTDLRTLVIDSLNQMVSEGALPEGLDFANVAVEPPRDPAHGDMATNAAMVLAKPARLKPRDIAEALAAKLADDPRITVAEVAGPGFLNLRLDPAVWQGLVKTVLDGGIDFGRLVEFLRNGAQTGQENEHRRTKLPHRKGHQRINRDARIGEPVGTFNTNLCQDRIEDTLAGKNLSPENSHGNRRPQNRRQVVKRPIEAECANALVQNHGDCQRHDQAGGNR